MDLVTEVSKTYRVVTEMINQNPDMWETKYKPSFGSQSYSVVYTERDAKRHHQKAIDFLTDFFKRPLEEMPILINDKDILTRDLAKHFLKFGGLW